jgi:hypothetical protein
MDPSSLNKFPNAASTGNYFFRQHGCRSLRFAQQLHQPKRNFARIRNISRVERNRRNPLVSAAAIFFRQ